MTVFYMLIFLLIDSIQKDKSNTEQPSWIAIIRSE